MKEDFRGVEDRMLDRGIDEFCKFESKYRIIMSTALLPDYGLIDFIQKQLLEKYNIKAYSLYGSFLGIDKDYKSDNVYKYIIILTYEYGKNNNITYGVYPYDEFGKLPILYDDKSKRHLYTDIINIKKDIIIADYGKYVKECIQNMGLDYGFKNDEFIKYIDLGIKYCFARIRRKKIFKDIILDIPFVMLQVIKDENELDSFILNISFPNINIEDIDISFKFNKHCCSEAFSKHYFYEVSFSYDEEYEGIINKVFYKTFVNHLGKYSMMASASLEMVMDYGKVTINEKCSNCLPEENGIELAYYDTYDGKSKPCIYKKASIDYMKGNNLFQKDIDFIIFELERIKRKESRDKNYMIRKLH